MPYYVLLAVIAIHALLVAYLAKLFHKERKDLYNRIMAKDYNEYATLEDKKPKQVMKSAHKKNIDEFHRKGLIE